MTVAVTYNGSLIPTGLTGPVESKTEAYLGRNTENIRMD